MNDLIVAGAGPAGLATAIYAARAGLDTVVIDRRRGPIDKACGEGLMPHTVGQLEKMGVGLHGRPFRGITYCDGVRTAEADFRSGKGMGVRRLSLSEALHDAAADAGARIVHRDIGPVSQDASGVRCSGLQARYLAAADGLHSPIRRSVGLERPARGRRRWGIRRHFQVEPWSDTVEVYWASGPGSAEAGEAYVTPVADDCVGVAILTSERGGFEDHLAAFPALAARIAGAPCSSSSRAAGPLRQRVRRRASGRVMLVGDAAGYIDALTGEGLGIAFGAAHLAATAVLDGSVGDYDRHWRAMSRRYRMLTAGLLLASAVPGVRSLIVPAAAAAPRAFGGIVNLLAA